MSKLYGKIQSTIYLPMEWVVALDTLANKKHKSRNAIINEAIRKYLEENGFDTEKLKVNLEVAYRMTESEVNESAK